MRFTTPYVISLLSFPARVLSTVAPPRIQRRDPNIITVGLDQSPVSIGTLSGSMLYDSVYKAIEQICPIHGGACTQGTTTFSVPMILPPTGNVLPITIFVPLTLTVHHAGWRGTESLRHLLSGAVAGSFERAATQPSSCTPLGYARGEQHCNTAQKVSVTFPRQTGVEGEDRGEVDMSVSLQVGKVVEKGVFQCADAVGAVGRYVEELEDEAGRVLGVGVEGVDVRCE